MGPNETRARPGSASNARSNRTCPPSCAARPTRAPPRKVTIKAPRCPCGDTAGAGGASPWAHAAGDALRLTARHRRAEHIQLVRELRRAVGVAPLLQPGRVDTGAKGADT